MKEKPTAASAQSVRFIMALAERAGTLRYGRQSATGPGEHVCSAGNVLILNQVACSAD
jgi:hypothetical protein